MSPKFPRPLWYRVGPNRLFGARIGKAIELRDERPWYRGLTYDPIRFLNT